MTGQDDLTAANVGEKLTQFALDLTRSEQKHRLTLIAYQLSNLKLFKVHLHFKPVKCRLFWHQSHTQQARESIKCNKFSP